MSNETFSAIRASREPGSTTKSIDWRIERIILHLQTQRRLEPTKAISRLADSVNLSTSRLRHLFKAETGKGLKQYLIESRIEMGEGAFGGEFAQRKGNSGPTRIQPRQPF